MIKCPYKKRMCIMVKNADNLTGSNDGSWNAFFITEVKEYTGGFQGHFDIHGYFIDDIVNIISTQEEVTENDMKSFADGNWIQRENLFKRYHFGGQYDEDYRPITENEKAEVSEKIYDLLFIARGEQLIETLKENFSEDALVCLNAVTSLTKQRVHPAQRAFLQEVADALK